MDNDLYSATLIQIIFPCKMDLLVYLRAILFGPIGTYSQGCGQILTIDNENIPTDYTLIPELSKSI